jgi:flagellar assembly protein FliH
MTRLLTLEDFDHPSPAGAAPGMPGTATAGIAAPPGAVDDRFAGVDLEEERLQAFEKGYRAGWDDAAAAHSGEQSRISTELGQNLQDMSFTYHEAYAALSREIAEVLRGLVGKVFPGAIGAALAETAEARIGEILAENRVPVEITVAPQNVARLEALVAGQAAPPLKIAAEGSLGEGQAYLRFGASEQRIDVGDVLEELAEAVERFAEPAGPGGDRAADPEVRHG